MRKRGRKYTHSDVWSAYLKGVGEDKSLLGRPEWYTIMASKFTEWHKDKFGTYP